MRIRPVVVLLLLLLGLPLAGGCGPGDGRVSVFGTVTYQGKPVPAGAITFLTTVGAPGPVCGDMIRDGRYDVPKTKGILPGTYRVMISYPGPGGELTPEEIAVGVSPRAKELLPAKYNTETTLTAEVKAGQRNHLDFKLE
jgi:hypothetical protein